MEKQVFTKSQKDIQSLRQRELQLSAAIDGLKTQMHRKKQCIQQMFDQIQPALIQSTNSVRNSNNISEYILVQSYAAPPIIQVTLKSLFILLTNHPSNPLWDRRHEVNTKNIKVLLAQNIHKMILQFRIQDVDEKIVDFVQREYLQADYWNIDRIHRTSLAAFTLAKWIECQIAYYEIIRTAKRIKEQIEQIEGQQKDLSHQRISFLKRIEKEQKMSESVIQDQQLILVKSTQFLKEKSSVKTD